MKDVGLGFLDQANVVQEGEEKNVWEQEAYFSTHLVWKLVYLVLPVQGSFVGFLQEP